MTILYLPYRPKEKIINKYDCLHFLFVDSEEHVECDSVFIKQMLPPIAILLVLHEEQQNQSCNWWLSN